MIWNKIEPLAVAHRGAAGVAPENTMTSFKTAYEQDCDAIELDVHLTFDQEIVVCHDDTVNRTTNGKGRIRALTLDQIRQLDAGSWRDLQFTGEKIPRLSEVLEWLPLDIGLNIELKDSAGGMLETQVINMVRKFDRMESVLFTSFDHKMLYRLKKQAPEAKIGLVYGAKLLNPMQLVQDFGLEVFSLHPNYRMIDKADVETLKQHGLQVFVWTVNQANDIQQMKEIKVSGIISDYVSRVKEIR